VTDGNLRLARPADAEAVHAIYAPIVRATPISFELEVPDVDEMRARIAKTLPLFPWLVWEAGGVLAGYAYASRHRDRRAYQWSVDVTCYVRQASRGRGVGTALYRKLIAILRRQGFFNAYAGITLPNPASVALHEGVGFRPVGVYRNVGYKAGAWRDVGWWACEIAPPMPDPPEPLALAALGPRILDEA
jgi:L-amino acid N-acyltransferase YncA